MDMALDPYKTLQVDEEADADVIRAAYRRLALKYHPDGGETPERGRRMAELNAAWEVLRDPQRRAEYDAGRQAQRPAPPAPRPVPTDGASAVRAAWGAAAGPRRAESANPLWTSGRSDIGAGYDAARMGRSMEMGSAGPPPGRPS